MQDGLELTTKGCLMMVCKRRNGAKTNVMTDGVEKGRPWTKKRLMHKMTFQWCNRTGADRGGYNHERWGARCWRGVCCVSFQGHCVRTVDDQCTASVVGNDGTVLNEVSTQDRLVEFGLAGPTDFSVEGASGIMGMDFTLCKRDVLVVGYSGDEGVTSNVSARLRRKHSAL